MLTNKVIVDMVLDMVDDKVLAEGVNGESLTGRRMATMCLL